MYQQKIWIGKHNKALYYNSGNAHSVTKTNYAKIGAGICYMIGGMISGIFLWKFSGVFCGFLYDVKTIREKLTEESQSKES